MRVWDWQIRCRERHWQLCQSAREARHAADESTAVMPRSACQLFQLPQQPADNPPLNFSLGDFVLPSGLPWLTALEEWEKGRQGRAAGCARDRVQTWLRPARSNAPIRRLGSMFHASARHSRRCEVMAIAENR